MISIPTPIAIVGMGLSGKSAYRLLMNLQFQPEMITRFDEKSADSDFQNALDMLTQFKPKTLVVSPGVPLTTKWIQDFQKSGGIITSELAIAVDCLTTEKMIAITGSIGKSTTTSLLAAGASAEDPHFFVGGNLGYPLADYVSDVLEKKRPLAKWVILELSSYQLENCGSLKPEISCITYLTSNHLERYDSLESYYNTKWILVDRTQNSVILNSNGGDLKKFSQQAVFPGHIQKIWTDRTDLRLQQYVLSEKKLIGTHNEDNLALAIHLSLSAGWKSKSIQLMKDYGGLPHRMENLGLIQGVQYINDSKATAIESVLTAVQSVLQNLKTTQSIYLLIGGKDKNLPWEDLKKIKTQPQIKTLFFGHCAETAKHKSQLVGEIYKTLAEATQNACTSSVPGDIILLSPGGTSLDEFKNFEDRGEKFKTYIQTFTQQKNN